MVGGSPVHIAHHAGNLGINMQMISAVGKDRLGEELLAALSDRGLSTDLIQHHPIFSTSIANEQDDEAEETGYWIKLPAAWDYIFSSEEEVKAVKEADILLYTSLVCRNEISRNTLLQLVDKAGIAVFDVNLCPPFYSISLIQTLLLVADVVKLSRAELDLVAGWSSLAKDVRGKMEHVAERYKIKTLVMLEGKEGAYCLQQGTWIYQTGFAVEIANLSGAGDAFLAAFISGLIKGTGLAECLEFACAMWAAVAGNTDGIPDVDLEVLDGMLKHQ